MTSVKSQSTPSSPFPGPLDKLWHGAAYYPELWPDQSIREELQRVKDAGLSVVRIGEFAWSKMEPEQDDFRFAFFVEVMDIALELGLAVVFGTPTPTPPVWLTHGHPDRVLHDIDGRPMSHGGRQHIAIDHPFVRERCRMIVSKLAEAVGTHSALIAWQVDNEFKCDVDADYGPSVRSVWEKWLQKRYGSIEGLNQAWGTGVWSQEYQSFEQVPFPMKCPGVHNASLTTAWKRFSRERIADYGAEQAAIIRTYSQAPITHNAGILFRSNPELVMASMDFVSFDHYVDCDNWHRMVANYDYWRNLKPERRFWLMETSSGHNGSLLGFHKPHPPGFVKAEAVASYALGGAAFCYWVWRQQRTGAELAHGCLMQSWDSPAMGMKAAHEVENARAELEGALQGKELQKAEVALMWSDTGRIMLQTEPHNGLEYTALLMEWAKTLRSTGVHVDLVPEADDLEGRRVLITPYMPALPPEVIERAKSFVERGGIWIAGPLTGGRTMEHAVHTDCGLGELEMLAGIRTVHSYPLFDSGSFGLGLGCRVELTGWSYLFESEGAAIVGEVEGGNTPGLGFLSEHSSGKGMVVVLGAEPIGEKRTEFLQTLFRHYAEKAEVSLRYKVSAGTLVAPWKGENGDLLVCVNMDGKGGQLSLPCTATESSSGGVCLEGKAIEIAPYGFKLLEVESGASEHANVGQLVEE